MFGARLIGSCVTLRLLYFIFLEPLRECLLQFYNRIRDELYLVGRKLESRNIHKNTETVTQNTPAECSEELAVAMDSMESLSNL